MRRPGTLPAATNHSTSVSQPRTSPAGLFCSPQTPGDITSNGSASLRTGNTNNHHSSHSLRRNHQSSPAPALPARGDSCTNERTQQANSRITNGMIPSHPPPPPRHSPPCPQSSYPTLPINGHVPTTHHYRHYRGERDRSRDRSLSRDREIIPVAHRSDGKLRNETLEMELHEDDSSNGIGTYRA